MPEITSKVLKDMGTKIFQSKEMEPFWKRQNYRSKETDIEIEAIDRDSESPSIKLTFPIQIGEPSAYFRSGETIYLGFDYDGVLTYISLNRDGKYINSMSEEDLRKSAEILSKAELTISKLYSEISESTEGKVPKR